MAMSDGMQPSTALRTIHRAPLLTFGRMNRRKDQIVLIEQRNASLIAGATWRIERELGQEPFA